MVARVNLYDSLLFFHVAGAFMLIAGVVVFWSLVVAAWRGSVVGFGPLAASIVRPTNVIVIVGTLATLVFGVWLALYVDGYELWDAWILSALVLWAVGTEAGRRAGNAFARAFESRERAETGLARQGLALHSISSLAFLVVLVLMIFKPGA